MARARFDAAAWIAQEIRSTVYRCKKDPTDIVSRIDSEDSMIRFIEADPTLGDVAHHVELRGHLAAMQADPAHPFWGMDTTEYERRNRR